jgi:hypothetical protein
MTMTLALLLTVVGPASGGPDVDCLDKPNHPLCQDPEPPDHPDGATCEADLGDGGAWMAATDEFRVEFSDKMYCVDWTTTKEAEWRITVTGPKVVRATVRDSHPGDFCWLSENTWQPVADGSGWTTVTNLIPEAAIDACGTEYLDVADPPEKAIPYVLTLSYRGKSSGFVVTVEEAAP